MSEYSLVNINIMKKILFALFFLCPVITMAESKLFLEQPIESKVFNQDKLIKKNNNALLKNVSAINKRSYDVFFNLQLLMDLHDIIKELTKLI